MVTGNTDQSYRMSFVTGGLMLNESIEVARLHTPGEDWHDTIAKAVQEGTTNLPKLASKRRTIREISNRLRTLSNEELCFFAEDAERSDQQALLWLAACRAYRFIREFACEVIREQYLSYQMDLPLQSFDLLLEAKAEWDDELAALRQTTRLKLRQVLFRMMREAGVLSAENRIQTAILSTRLRIMIDQSSPGELAFFPGMAPGVEIS